jgi:hypothetical protein
MPICRGIVLTFIEIKDFSGFKSRVKRMPIKMDNAALPTYKRRVKNNTKTMYIIS